MCEIFEKCQLKILLIIRNYPLTIRFFSVSIRIGIMCLRNNLIEGKTQSSAYHQIVTIPIAIYCQKNDQNNFRV